jgi:hypothetical protein
MLAAVKRGVKPPACKGKKACDVYCQNPEHMEECMNFALEAGFMTDQEKADSQKMLAALKKGVKPPACRGKDECDVYCSQDEHMEECMNFAEAAGFMSPEEAAMARKTGGKGPGGCKGKEECEAFCNNPDNQETCFNFGKEHGLIPEEDLRMMEESQKFQPGPGMETPGGQIMPPQAGPGGCKGPDECKSFCETNPDQCKNFTPPQGILPAGEMKPPENMMSPQGMTPPLEGMMPPPPEQIPPPPSPEQISPNLLQIFLNFLKGK